MSVRRLLFASADDARLRKAIVLAMVCLAHGLLLLALLLDPLGHRAGPGRGAAAALAVFDLGAAADRSALPLPPPVAASPDAAPPSIPAVGQAAAGGSDPFAGAALAMSASRDAAPAATGPAAAAAPLLVDQAALDALLRTFASAHAGATGTASFVVTVLPDGSIRDVRYVEGSIDAGAAADLARALEGRTIYPPGGSGPRRIVLGPLPVG